MALVACRECGVDVSDEAQKCPQCGVRLRKAKRGIFGKLFKWLFILFNILMVLWLWSYWSEIGKMTTSSDAESAGKAIGATLGTGFLVSIWASGDIVLGILVLLTRARD